MGVGWARARGLFSGQGVSESSERSQELVAPGPGAGVVDPEVESSASCGEAGCDVEEPVAQRFRFGFGQVTIEAQELSPGQKVCGDDRGGEPGLVANEVFEGEVVQAAVFPVADAVLDSGVTTVAEFQLSLG